MEARVSTLKAYIVSRGPENMTFSEASRKPFVAKRNVESLSAQGELGAGGQTVLKTSMETLEDKELTGFVRRQRLAREKLKELGVQLPDENTLQNDNTKRQRTLESTSERPSDKKRKPEERAPDNKGSNKDPLAGTSGQKKAKAKNKGAITKQKSKTKNKGQIPTAGECH
ncbi:hypothetical protein ACFFRR_003658 [Megaselia abdita]